MSARRYIDARRLGLVEAVLDDDDWKLLRSLGLVRVARGTQLQRLIQGSLDEASKQRRIRQTTRLSRAGLITVLTRRVGGVGGGSGSTVFVLDVAGQRIIEGRYAAGRRPWTPSTPFLQHQLEITELYVGLVEAERRRTIELLEFEVEPGCWRQFRTRTGSNLVLKPDARSVVAEDDNEFHHFIEVDLGTETIPKLRQKLRIYVDYFDTGSEQRATGVFPRTLWVTTNAHRAAQIRRTVDETGRHRDLFVVTDSAAAATATLSGREGGR